MSQFKTQATVMEYENSVTFGKYHEKLANFARNEAQKQKQLKKSNSLSRTRIFSQEFAKKLHAIFGDYHIFFLLSFLTSVLSFVVDMAAHGLTFIKNEMMFHFSGSSYVKYVIWTLYSVFLILIASIIVRTLSPQAAGSGIGEMKVAVRGVTLKAYLSKKTLLAKLLGVPLVLASGLGVGKEGPFVHIASMIAYQLIKVFGFTKISPIEDIMRYQEFITIACGVGVAATFAAPIGSVLYSIEIVKSFFAVRSYFQGFIATTMAAIFWRMFYVWFGLQSHPTTHIIPTYFRKDSSYVATEIFAFAVLGVICGIGSYLFVSIQRNVVLFNRSSNKVANFFKSTPIAYPLIVSFIIASLKFPQMFGKYFASELSMEAAMHLLYSNFTWGPFTKAQHYNTLLEEAHIIHNFETKYTSIYATTFLFFVMNVIIIGVASTVPVPGGLIVPLFMTGAGLGRFFGEITHVFSEKTGIFKDEGDLRIVVGAYAVAGSAGFTGAVTGSLSVAVIAFEVTGQLTHFLPIIVCVIVSNVVARRMGPSTYECLMKLKNLPFLPTSIKNHVEARKLLVEEFMERDVPLVYKGITYRYLKTLLLDDRLLVYPFVSNPNEKYFLGTIQSSELKLMIERHLGLESTKARLKIFSSVLPCIKMTDEQTQEIEKKLDEEVDFSSCQIDPAPLQLMEGTPLTNVHNVFSLLCLQVVFVTSSGILTGAVTLKNLRDVIEDVEQKQ